MSLNAPLWRDSNQAPVQIGGVISRKSQTLASTGTVVTPIFRITGTVQCIALYGIVTTTLGTNNTAAAWRLNDQTVQVDITLSTGTTLSASPAGSFLSRRGLAASALSIRSATQGQVNETASAGAAFFSPFTVTKKPGANTDIEFVYTTTDNPTSGVIQHFLVWLPVSQDAAVVAQ